MRINYKCHSLNLHTKSTRSNIADRLQMHVNAKRYLGALDKDYWASLSTASKTSFKLQGGIFSEAEATEFINQPYTNDAVKLRIWDDLAKVKGLKTPDAKYFMPAMEKLIVNIGHDQA